jgi:uncharacterized membrane protein
MMLLNHHHFLWFVLVLVLFYLRIGIGLFQQRNMKIFIDYHLGPNETLSTYLLFA